MKSKSMILPPSLGMLFNTLLKELFPCEAGGGEIGLLYIYSDYCMARFSIY